MHTNSGHAYTHAQSQRHTIIVTHTGAHTHRDIYTSAYTNTHPPHGVGNMSEQSIIWHLNQSLLLEVWRNAAGKICLDDKQLGNSFSPLTALKVKETYIFPKHWLVHVERLHCAVLYLCVVVPRFYLRQFKIWKGIPQSKAFLLWLLFSCCFVTVKATGKLVVTRRCIQTQNSAILAIQQQKMHLLSGKHRIQACLGGEI